MSIEDTAPFRDTFRHLAHSCLLAAVRARDRSALEKLYLAYYPHLARFLAHCTNRDDIVQNAIDDAFIILWSQGESLPRKSAAFTSIFGLAYSEVTRTLQLEKRTAATRPRGEGRLPPTDTVRANPFRHERRRSMDSLPMEQRATVSLAYHLDCSVEEIAQIMRTSPQTVLSRMSSAGSHLRRARPMASGVFAKCIASAQAEPRWDRDILRATASAR